MKINNKEHQKQPWIVHDLLSDFEIEDVWKFPVTLESEHTIPMFQAQLKEAMEQLSKRGLAGQLFKLRFYLGKIFGWDKTPKVVKKSITPGSIRERYAHKNNLSATDLPNVGTADFIPVYTLENESLAEIENETVHAGMHLGKVRCEDKYTVHMAVYVKPKGWLGKFYMALIKPFRLTIVYPAMMRIVGDHWSKYTT